MKKIIRFFLRNVPRKYLQKISHIASQMISIFYLGNKVECPVCGRHYRKFLPYGYVQSRENALCPNCLALERHRLLWLYLLRQTDFFTRRQKMLHIAPEYCFMRSFEKWLGKDYITADLESPLAKVKMNVEEIPFPDNTFEVVFCNHIMEHVYDYQKGLREIYRVMKPGGWGVILSPINGLRAYTYEDLSITDPCEREKHFGQKDHLREFGSDYPNLLEKAGFKVERSEFWASLSAEELSKFALGRPGDISIGDVIFIVKK